MANDISARPWFIDTASGTVIYTPQVYIKFIEVVGGTTAVIGATMADIQDANGKSIVKALNQTANNGELQTFNLENWFRGLKVPTLETGVTLRVHVR